MIFEIDSAILQKEDLHHLLMEVTASVWGSEIGRHQWFIPDPEKFKSSSWFADYLSLPQQKDFEKKATKSALENPKRKRNFFKARLHADEANAVFTLSDTKKLLSSPLLVVVEGAGSDGTFVKALIRCFGDDKIKYALEQKWVDFDNAGGSGNIKAAILRMEEKLGVEVAKRRSFSLCDSDSEHAQDDWRAKPEFKDMLELIEKGYELHVLYKRMIENYLPNEALKELMKSESGVETHKLLHAVLSFSFEQRDFYHLKKGFSYNVKKDSQYPQILFPSIKKNSPEYRVLHDGFKKVNLSGGFHHATALTLEARCSHHPQEHKDELKKIVRTLLEML